MLCVLSAGAKTTQTRITFGNIWQSLILGNDLSWTNSGTWDNGVPAVGDTVIVRLPTDFNISSETLAELETRSKLDIESGNTLKITSELRLVGNQINVNGNLIIVGDASNYGRVTVASGGNINGTFTYEKWVDRCNKWSLYGGPFDATLNEYADSATGQMIYTGFPNSDYPTFGTGNAFLWDEDHVGTGGWITPDGNATIPRGTGFWYWNSDTIFNSPLPSIPQKWKVATAGSIDFTATFNFPVKYTNSGDITSDGWNLLANPYPGVMDWNDAGLSRTNVDDAIYVFNTCNQTYASYVGGVGTNGGTNFIAPFQGFYVKANAASPSLSTVSSVIANNNQDLFRNSNPLDNILRVQLGNDEIIVRANDNANDDFNPSFDAYKNIGDSSTIYSKLGLVDYAINSVNDSTEAIPLYTLGGGTLYFSDIHTWESHYDLYLEDKALGTMTSLNTINSYAFTTMAPVYINRFVIHLFGGIPLSSEEEDDKNGVSVSYSQGDVIIKMDYNEQVNIEMYNMLGQKVMVDKIIFNEGGYRMKSPGQISVLRIFNNEIDKSVKVF